MSTPAWIQRLLSDKRCVCARGIDDESLQRAEQMYGHRFVAEYRELLKHCAALKVGKEVFWQHGPDATRGYVFSELIHDWISQEHASGYMPFVDLGNGDLYVLGDEDGAAYMYHHELDEMEYQASSLSSWLCRILDNDPPYLYCGKEP